MWLPTPRLRNGAADTAVTFGLVLSLEESLHLFEFMLALAFRSPDSPNLFSWVEADDGLGSADVGDQVDRVIHHLVGCTVLYSIELYCTVLYLVGCIEGGVLTQSPQAQYRGLC